MPDLETHSKGKPTLKFNSTSTPLQLREQSSIISLNLQELRTLMKRKERQYQEQLQIQDAQRVHSFFMEQLQKKKEEALNTQKEHNFKLKKQIYQYNRHTLKQFQNQWRNRLSNTVKQLKKVGETAAEQHAAQLQAAAKEMQQVRGGSCLQKIKYSKTILQMQDQLRRLVRSQRYDEADVVQKRLQAKKKQECALKLKESIQRERQSIHKLKKRQSAEKELLSVKLSQIYKKQQIRYEQQTDMLVKNMRTYQIDFGKISATINRKSRIGRINSQRLKEPVTANKSDCVLQVSEIKTERYNQQISIK